MSTMNFASAGQQGPAQLADSLAPAGGTLASTAMSAGRGIAAGVKSAGGVKSAEGAKKTARTLAFGPALRSFGLSMRFIVKFSNHGGIADLGEWSSCKGLKVEFKTDPVKLGGEYCEEVKLPTFVTYSPIVLERAVEHDVSGKLQAWLAKMAKSWVEYDAHGSPSGGTVHITLLDAHGKSVMTWVLEEVFPVSWTGPTLDVKQNSVALETLTLEHGGFLPPSGDTAAKV